MVKLFSKRDLHRFKAFQALENRLLWNIASQEQIGENFGGGEMREIVENQDTWTP